MTAADDSGQQATPAAADRQALEIALFPLGVVLFPGGVLPLKVFEQRYLDMTADCIRNEMPFGVCLIASGQEVGAAAEPWQVGTLAHIVEVDVPQLGIMQLTVRGGRRFRIVATTRLAGGLLRARVTQLAEPAERLPTRHAALHTLLQAIAAELAPGQLPPPHAFDDAAWVGYRLAELLPLAPLARQALLELGDPAARLDALAAHVSLQRLIGGE